MMKKTDIKKRGALKQLGKSDVVARVAKSTGVKKDQVSRMVNETFTALRDIICEADPEIKVNIRDFGCFEVSGTKGRAHPRNPGGNQPAAAGARKRVAFRPGKSLREFLKRQK